MRVNATGAETWTPAGGATRLVHAAATHPGRVRTVNEDSLLVAPPVFVVADGMGGYERGDAASRLVVEAFAPLAGLGVVQPADIDAAVRSAQQQVAALVGADGSAPGSTLVAAAHVIEDGRGYWLVANIGDSRAYLLANGVLEQISRDHSVVQELIDAGELTRDEALGHPERHVVTRAIGAHTLSEPDFALVPAEVGSRQLLCYDGLPTEISDTAILHILAEDGPAERTVNTLVDAAVAAGGHDNVTVVVVDVAGTADERVEHTRPNAGERSRS